MISSIHDIDLAPKKSKIYWSNCQREWREEFIYFLLVDRFHDNNKRLPVKTTGKSSGFGNEEQLQISCGGTIKGITDHLDYIKGLGCTALWLSPVFENNPESYHGYSIQNFLSVDKRFGTKEDLEELVTAAHELDMRVFLDIVLHHSGNNWEYQKGLDYYYYNGVIFPFGKWRYKDLPIPVELRNPDLYGRKGQIRNFDAYPETRDGDFFNLKAFRHDDSPEALYVLELLTKIHCYWIRETDIDGFRIDAVKHMGEKAISQFCSHMREYAYKLGKRSFFIFGELVGPEELYNKYIGPKTSVIIGDEAIYYGLNSVLDFYLYHVLPEVIKGQDTPERLINRYEALRKSAMNRGEFGEFLITFLDNHDQVGQVIKRRFGKDASEAQIIAGVGFLLCALGTPCIYYGTEQGMDGSGEADFFVRECMFNPEDQQTNILSPESRIYKEISKIASIRRRSSVLRFGRMYMRKFSNDGKTFQLPVYKDCLLAFSRVLFDEEVVVAYNTSLTIDDEEYIVVDANINPEGSKYSFLYGGTGEISVLKNEGDNTHFIKLTLKPGQFVILKNSI